MQTAESWKQQKPPVHSTPSGHEQLASKFLDFSIIHYIQCNTISGVSSGFVKGKEGEELAHETSRIYHWVGTEVCLSTGAHPNLLDQPGKPRFSSLVLAFKL